MGDVETEMRARDVASVVVRRRWLVVVAVVSAGVVSLLLTAFQTPVYEATSEVLIEAAGEDGLFEDQLSADDRSIRTETEVIEREAVRTRVQRDLSLDELPPEAEAEEVGDTDLIAITVRDTNPTNAAVYADAYAMAFIEERRERSVEQLLAATAEVQAAIDELQTEIDALEDDDPQRGALIGQQASFSTLLDQLRVDAALRTGGAAMVRSAEVPTDPVEPTPWRTAALAMGVGLLVGLGAAFVVEHLDDRVRTERDLRRVTSRPVLTAIPDDAVVDDRPLAVTDPTHPSLEAYRGLRANLQFLGLDRPMKVVQVTSASAGEGKTTVAANLAVILAQAGHEVALVDADLRRPRIHVAFALSASPGVSELLVGADAPPEVVQHVTVEGGHRLAVFTSGDVPSNPGEMLTRARAEALFRDLGRRFDYVVVDSPPVLPVSDAVSLSGAADGVLLVAQAGRIAGDDTAEALNRLERVGAHVLGVVLNRTSGARRSPYSYGDDTPRPLPPPDPRQIARTQGPASLDA